MLRTNLGVFDVSKLDESAENYLYEYFQQNPNEKYFDQSRRYTLLKHNKDSNTMLSYEFKLSHSILLRERKPGKIGIRYEVISNGKLLGKGGEGVVYRTEGVLIPQRQHFQFKKKQRALKATKRLDSLANEYKAARLTNYLHPKPVTLTLFGAGYKPKEAMGFMANRIIPGRNLHLIIEAESFGNAIMLADHRIDASIAVLNAVDELHSAGIIHRDIKAENILIDLATMQAKLIDLSMSKIQNDPTCLPTAGGTLLMMPAEQFHEQADGTYLYSMKSDSYATGKTLAELWCVESQVNIIADQSDQNSEDTDFISLYYEYAKSDTVFDYSNFLAGNLSIAHQEFIKQIFEGLTRAHIDDRWSIDRALAAFQKIKEERQEIVQPASPRSLNF